MKMWSIKEKLDPLQKYGHNHVQVKVFSMGNIKRALLIDDARKLELKLKNMPRKAAFSPATYRTGMHMWCSSLPKPHGCALTNSRKKEAGYWRLRAFRHVL